jgi:hypothetical protein
MELYYYTIIPTLVPPFGLTFLHGSTAPIREIYEDDIDFILICCALLYYIHPWTLMSEAPDNVCFKKNLVIVDDDDNIG